MRVKKDIATTNGEFNTMPFRFVCITTVIDNRMQEIDVSVLAIHVGIHETLRASVIALVSNFNINKFWEFRNRLSFFGHITHTSTETMTCRVIVIMIVVIIFYHNTVVGITISNPIVAVFGYTHVFILTEQVYAIRIRTFVMPFNRIIYKILFIGTADNDNLRILNHVTKVIDRCLNVVVEIQFSTAVHPKPFIVTIIFMVFLKMFLDKRIILFHFRIKSAHDFNKCIVIHDIGKDVLYFRLASCSNCIGTTIIVVALENIQVFKQFPVVTVDK